MLIHKTRGTHLVFLSILFCCISAHAKKTQHDGISLNYIPEHARYNIKPMISGFNETAFIYTSFFLKLQYQDYYDNKSRFIYSIGYTCVNHIYTLYQDDEHEVDITGPFHFIDLSCNYSYDITLCKWLILNPEPGINLQLPIIGNNAYNDHINYKSIPPPILGLNLNIWLKHQQKNGNTFGFGVTGCLPFYSIVFGEFQKDKVSADIRSGFGYTGIAFMYTLNLDPKRLFSRNTFKTLSL